MLFSMMIAPLKIEAQKYNMIKVVDDNHDNSHVRSGNIYNIHLQPNLMPLSPDLLDFFPHLLNCRFTDKTVDDAPPA